MLKKWHLLICGIFLVVPTLSWSMACHCYSQKNFDPNQPTAADPYYLATSQNSLLATVYGIEKRKIVLIKQKPSTTSERLWVAHWLADKTKTTPDQWLKSRYRDGSWKAALAGQQIEEQRFGDQFSNLLESFDVDNNLSRYVVDDILLTQKMIDRTQLNGLRNMGSSDSETILSCILALKTEQPASDFYHAVKLGGASWGSHLLNAGIDGTQMVTEIKNLLATHQQLI